MRLSKSRRRWVGHVACAGNRRGAYSILVGNPARTRRVVIRSLKWQGNIKTDHHVLGYIARSGLIWLKIRTNDGLL